MIDYAKKISQLAALDEGRALLATEKLIKELKARGEEKQLPEILRGLKAEAGRRKALEPVLEIAREEDAPGALAAAKAAGIEAKNARVNPSLIRGWRARANGMLVDRSGKRALTELYAKITK